MATKAATAAVAAGGGGDHGGGYVTDSTDDCYEVRKCLGVAVGGRYDWEGAWV